MSGADGNAEDRVHDESQAAGGFGGESAKGSQFCDALAHGFDNAPATGHGAAAHREVATYDNLEGNMISFDQAAREERGGDDAHPILCVVGAMAEAEEGSGEKLQAAESALQVEG